MTVAAFPISLLPRFARAPHTVEAPRPRDERANDQARREFALGLMSTHPGGFNSAESMIEAMFYLSGRD